MKKIALVLLFSLFVWMPAMAANTVTKGDGNRVVQISSIDSDWILTSETGLTQYASGGAPIKAIFFYPGAANDILMVRSSAADTGPVLAKLKSLDGEPRVMYFHDALLKPVIDYSDCTLSSGAFVVIVFGKP